jgi:hypothetical protein
MDVEPKSCCSSLPVVPKDKAATLKCIKECEGKSRCCNIDCGLREQRFADETGKFDAKSAKEQIAALSKGANYVSCRLPLLFLSLKINSLKASR